MRLKILYDNEALSGYLNDWGFSCLVEHSNRMILFDTGKDGKILLRNMEMAGIEKEEIDTVVLSHNHRDHTGGLVHVAHPNLTVYVPVSFAKQIEMETKKIGPVIEVKDPTRIDKGVHTTGELGTSIIEQSLVVESDRGLVLITGCAHPGLENIIDTAKKLGDICCVVGGFHTFYELEKLSDIRLISPCHCTSRKVDIRRIYPEACVECAAGKTIDFKS